MDTLQLFRKQIRPLLDFRKEPSRVATLLVRLKTNELAARDEAKKELVQSTLKFVEELAYAHCIKFNTWQSQLDLIQEASAEISRRISSYNPNKASLESFIRRTAHYAFVAFWYNMQLIHTTSHGRKMNRLVKRAESELTAKLGRPPTLEELADHLDKAQSEILSIQLRSAASISDLGESLYEGEDSAIPISETMESREKSPYQLTRSNEIQRISLEVLGKKNAHLLAVYYDEGVESFQAWHRIYYGTDITKVNARQKAKRFKDEVINFIRRIEPQS